MATDSSTPRSVRPAGTLTTVVARALDPARLGAKVAAGASDEAEREVQDALAAGDHHRALTLVMRRHGDGVYHYCRRLVGDELAPDVHQQAFIDAFRGLDRFDGRSTVRTWLFAIARHRCIDALRRRDRRRAHEPRAATDADDAPDPGPDVGCRVDERRAFDLLRGCIDQLAPATRSAVLLRYQEGLAYEDLSTMFDEPAGTIGRRVARALIALRTCVERHAGGSP